MKKIICFSVVIYFLYFSLFSVNAKEMTVLKDVTSGTVTKKVHANDGKHNRDVEFIYNISDVTRIAAYSDVAKVGNYSMIYYQVGAYSEDTGKYRRGMTVYFDDEDPVSTDVSNTFSGVGFFMDFDNNYCTDDSSCSISGCPVFSSYEACEKYLKFGEYDSSDLISPTGVDKDGNPLENYYEVEIDKDIPLPQNFHWYDSTVTSANSSNPVFDSYFTWDNVKDVKNGDFNAEIQVKFEFSYKGYFGRTLRNGATSRFPSDWFTITPSELDTMEKMLYFTENSSLSPRSVQSELQIADSVANRYGIHHRLPSEINVGISNKIYDTFVAHDFQYRIRNFYYLGNVKKCSNWVLKSIDDRSSLTNNSDGDNDAIITDNDGKPVDDYDYEQDSANDSSNSSLNSKESIFGWLTRQIDGLNRFFISVKKSFSSATDAGTSFMGMFKSYNSWLPESFFTMLVTGIGIVILLRILGR